MKSFVRKLAIASVITSLASTAAMATPVSYYGAIFDLAIQDIGGVGGTYRVTYTADFTNFTNSAAQPYIDAVAWKHAGADVSTVSLFSFPSSSGSGSGGWTTTADSTVNAGGCSGNGGNTWACSDDNVLPYSPTASSGLLTWIFDATFSTNVLSSLDTTGDSIKMRFVDRWGNKEGALLSCTLNGNTEDNCSLTTTKVPEPSSIALFGLGLLGLSARFARRLRAK